MCAVFLHGVGARHGCTVWVHGVGVGARRGCTAWVHGVGTFVLYTPSGVPLK